MKQLRALLTAVFVATLLVFPMAARADEDAFWSDVLSEEEGAVVELSEDEVLEGQTYEGQEAQPLPKGKETDGDNYGEMALNPFVDNDSDELL